MECLLGNIIQDRKLPGKAVATLIDLLDRMQSVCRKYIK